MQPERHMPLKLFFQLMLLLASLNTQAQKSAQFEVASVPYISYFELLTAREQQLDTMKARFAAEKLKALRDGSAFLETATDADKKIMIENEEARNLRYKDNRSRYNISSLLNNTKEKDVFEEVDTLTTECDCYLSNDTIKVNMGIWVFGGFRFSLNISKDRFNGEYWEDTHEQMIYKQQLSAGKLVDNVTVGFEKQRLVLQEHPAFQVGGKLLGFLAFRSMPWYRTPDYSPGSAAEAYSDKKMDTTAVEGYLHFKCVVRKKTIFDP